MSKLWSPTPWKTGMRWHEEGTLRYLTSPNLGIRFHAFYSRFGGHSKPPFDTLNVGRLCGDDLDAVDKNLATIKHHTKAKRLVSCIQVHQDHIAIVDDTSPDIIPSCDGLLTKCKETALLIKNADCQGAIFYDPKREVLGVVHCGWRGAVQKIYEKMVQKMHDHFDSRASDIQVAISPSLGPLHFEFRSFESDLPQSFWPYQVAPRMFDFWAIARDEFIDLGISKDNIDIAAVCTYESKAFFSYRRNPQTGRGATVATL